MSKKIRKTMLAGLLSFSVLLFGAAIVNVYDAGALATDGWSEVEIAETYLQGETLTIPDRIFTLNGVEKPATVTVTYPDKSTTTNSTLRLRMAGKYTVSYTAVVEGRVYKEVETFVANYRTANYTGEGTSVEYGSHALASDVYGLVVRLEEKDKLLFNEVIDLNETTVSDTLFEAFVTADTPGNLDFAKLYVQFTDVEDANNYFKLRYIHTKSSAGGPYTYVLAGANGQSMTGLEGSNQKIHVEGDWGTTVRHSFLCDYYGNDAEIGQTRLKVQYNAATKEVYAGNEFVVDLDNPRYFTNLWDGFKSGQVQVSVWADDYSTNSANFVVTKVGDIDLSKEFMQENTPPTITIDTKYTATTMPKAKVGMEYTVPMATAYDLYSGECTVTTEVYYNYTSQPTRVALNNQRFSAEHVGEYAIVYTAEDVLGNVSKEVLWVDSVQTLPAPQITLNGSLPTEQNAGIAITLPTYEVNGGSGNSVVKIYVNDGQTEREVMGQTYRPDVVGVHTFTYVATDYIGQESREPLTMTVTAGTEPIFVDSVQLPNYFIAGFAYDLPKLYANDYTSGTLVRRLATVTVKDANNTNVIAAGEKYVPAVTNNLDCVEIVYQVDNVTYPTILVPTVKAKDSTAVYVENYFDLTGATLTLGDRSSEITATQNNASWRFANSLIAENVELVLDAIPAKNTFDGLKITYTDSVDSSISIEVYIYKDGKTSKIRIGKTEFYDANVGFASDSKSKRFKIGYTDGAIVVNNASVVVNSTVDGQEFNGFPSSKIYVTCAFINATVGSAYNVVEVNGQKVTNMGMDLVAPKIVILGARGGTKPVNTTTVLPAALAGDTLDPNVTFTLTVKTPSQKIVTSVDGVLLDGADPTREYEIELTEYGQYSIRYEAKDSRGNSTPGGYAINVDDAIGPVITFSHSFKTTAKVGDTLIIPSYTVNDNVDEAKDIVTINLCVAPTGEVLTLTNGNSVVAKQAGIYQLRVMAIDASGNITLHQVDVVVTE